MMPALEQLEAAFLNAKRCKMFASEPEGLLKREDVYCLSRSGVTGARPGLELAHAKMFEELARAGAPPPVLGFGLSQPGHVRAALAKGAAGAISGSAIVRPVEAAGGDPAAEVQGFVRTMKEATRRARAVCSAPCDRETSNVRG
jgi:tryptophan synthase alpha subunit